MNRESLAAEIKSKVNRLDICTLSVLGKGHIDWHIAQSNEDLKNRIKNEHLTYASSYTDKEVAQEAIFNAFLDEVNLKSVLDWLINEPQNSQKDLPFTFEDPDKKFGVIIDRDGNEIEPEIYQISFERSERTDRNLVTGMPFDIKTTFPTTWDLFAENAKYQ